MLKHLTENTYLFLTDAPPMRSLGIGNFSLASYLVRALEDVIAVVVTHRYQRRHHQGNLSKETSVPCLLYPDTCVFGLGRILKRNAHVADFLLFILYLPLLKRKLKRFRAKRMFVLAGANLHFLPLSYLLSRALGIPFDIYLVDDIESSAKSSGRNMVAKLVRPIENFVLQRAHRVFCISRGYCEHLHDKYGIEAELLPVCAPGCERIEEGQGPGKGLREIVFCGSVNQLYLSGLKDLDAAVRQWNAQKEKPFILGIHMIGMHYPVRLMESLEEKSHIRVSLRLDPSTLHLEMKRAWATFLPYAFSPESEMMVRTSFSSKILDSLRGGRPILVYGPSYSSLAQWFADKELGIVVCDEGVNGLLEGLKLVERADVEKLVDGYRRVGIEEHSLQAARRYILEA